jgi:hypothetical protein
LSRVTGSGTTNYVAKFTGSTAVGNSQIFDNGTIVGIGTASPQNKLDISETSGTTVLQLSNAFNTPSNRNWSLQSNYNAYGDFTINQSNALFGNPNTAGTPRLYISASGNVGIGTTSPQRKLNIVVSPGTTSSDGLRVDNGTQNALLDVTGSAYVYRGVPANSAMLYSNSNVSTLSDGGYISYHTSGGERMRITSDGEVLIGTTTDAGAYALQVAGSIYNTTGAVFAATSGTVNVGTTSTPASVDGIAAKVFISAENSNYGYAALFRADNIGRGIRLVSSDHNSGTSTGSGIIINTSAIQATANGGTANANLSINASGANVGIGIAAASVTERLHVNGRVRIATIDSSASPINMLWADANGVIQKSAPAIQGSGTNLRMAQFTGTSTVGNSNMYITSGGNGYGLNTSNIISFTDYGTLNLNGNVGAIYYFKLADTVRGLFGMAASTIGGLLSQSTLEINNTTDGPIVFSTNGSVRSRITSAGELWVNVGADNGDYRLQVQGNAYVQLETMLGATGDFGAYTLQVTGESIFDGAITTQQPGGSIATKIPWKLGNVATVTPTSPNRTISVEINGTTYYLHAKTTND